MFAFHFWSWTPWSSVRDGSIKTHKWHPLALEWLAMCFRDTATWVARVILTAITYYSLLVPDNFWNKRFTRQIMWNSHCVKKIGFKDWMTFPITTSTSLRTRFLPSQKTNKETLQNKPCHWSLWAMSAENTNSEVCCQSPGCVYI